MPKRRRLLVLLHGRLIPFVPKRRRLLALASLRGRPTRVVPDQELFDTAMNWGIRLAGQAPIAVEQIKKVLFSGGDPDQGIDAEKQGFSTAFLSEDAKEGIGAFLGKRTPKWQGK